MPHEGPKSVVIVNLNLEDRLVNVGQWVSVAGVVSAALGPDWQMHEHGVERPIEYAARGLNSAERNYGITDKEAAAPSYPADNAAQCHLEIDSNEILAMSIAPSKPTVSGITTTVLTLRWVAPEPSCDGYRIDCQAGCGEWQTSVPSCCKTSRAITGLQPDTIYRFRIYAINQSRLSPPSPPSESVRTQPHQLQPTGRALTRPQTAPVQRKAELAELALDQPLVRRRYFFGRASCPFDQHYDVVTLDPTNRQQARAGWVPVGQLEPDTDIQTLYYQDHRLCGNSYALQHNLHTLVPQGRMDLAQLMAWLTAVRPRDKLDAVPLFVLIQNLLRSVLSDKLKFGRHQADKTEIIHLREQVRLLGQQLQKGEAEQKAEAEAAKAKAAASEALAAALRLEAADSSVRWQSKLREAERKIQELDQQNRALQKQVTEQSVGMVAIGPAAEPSAEEPGEAEAGAVPTEQLESRCKKCWEVSPSIYKKIVPNSPNGPLTDGILGGFLVKMELKKGEADPVSQHTDRLVYFLKGDKLKITLKGGNTVVKELHDGATVAMEAGVVSVKNVGDTDIEALFFEQGDGVGETPEGHFSCLEAEPTHYKVLCENEDWMLIDMFMKPGEEDKPHSHRDHVVYVLDANELTLYDGKEKVHEKKMVASVSAGAVLPVSTGFRIVMNTGTTNAHTIFWERKK